jgi:two-component system, OmpR family, sensor histidine kinase KdpD
MSEEDVSRPDPDALLAEVKKESRGRLKIFLGAAPGVGKTYEMLRSGRAAKRDGIDVVVGIVETHGRRETERLVSGLEVLPRKVFPYRGRTLPEMDLDALVERKPKLALVDELAHTNAPGSRHAKRWQDVEELLDAGIDVFTTLNVQHLESLNDIVERISGIRVRETLPDAVLERADEIEMIDITPEELRKRLREGKVYIPEQAERAITRFFSRGNLTALREMALRAAAERVDREMIDFMRSHAVGGAWPTRERLLVCIGTGGDPERVVRTGKRMADRSRAPWIVLQLVESGHADAAAYRAMILAEQLGADTETVTVAGTPDGAILDFARRQNVSRIVLGRPKSLSRIFGRPFHERLIESGGEFEVTVIGHTERQSIPARRPRLRTIQPHSLRPYLAGALYVAVAVAFGFLVERVLPLANLSLVFLAAVLAASRFGNLGAAVSTSLLSFLAYNFFYTEPYLTFFMWHASEILTLAVFLVFSLLIGTLAARLNRQMEAMRIANRQTRALYEFTRKALSATNDYDIAWTVVAQVGASLAAETVLLAPDSRGDLTVAAGSPPIDEIDESAAAAADWAWRHGGRAGWTTDTLPNSRWLFMPLVAQERTLGVLGVAREDAGDTLSAADRRLLDTLVDQAALILERARMTVETAEAQRYSQTEKLRTALLSSISHDLRTPLVSIIGAVSTLLSLDERIDAKARGELLRTISSEAARLNSFIQNLLDMTRLGYGALGIRRDWLDLADVIAAARERLAVRLNDVPVEISIEPAAEFIHADLTLLEQVVVNLLDNAARYAPSGTPVTVEARTKDGNIVISVGDQGPGIPPHQREQIFDLFWRAASGDRSGTGTGLGLFIVRGFVEAMGGQVTVGERNEGGARFEIDLPQPPRPLIPAEGDDDQ